MRQIVKALTSTTAVTTAVCAAQQPLAAGALTLNGSSVVSGVAVLPAAYNVTITSNGNDSVRTFTVVGTDEDGLPITEVVTGPNTTTVSSTLYFATVTSVTISGASVGTSITAGFGGAAVTPTLPLDMHGRPEISLQVAVTSGAPTWTVQQTLDNPWTVAVPVWFDHPDTNMVTQTVNRQGNYAYVPAAVRLKLTPAVGSATLTIIQAGITG